MKQTITTAIALFSIIGITFARQLPIPSGNPSIWKAHDDGGDSPAVSVGIAKGESPSVRFAYRNGRGYGNSRLDNITLPPDSYGITFNIYVEDAAPGAAMYVWLFETDGDVWMTRITPEDKKDIDAVKGTWRQVSVPFSALAYQPRGDKKRNFLSVNRMLMGFNFADQNVCVAGLSLSLLDQATASIKKNTLFEPSTDPSGRRIAILHESGFKKEPGHADPKRLAHQLRKSGFSPVFISSNDLADPSHFSIKNTDLVVIPCAPYFPKAAVKNFRNFLKEGGAFFSIGGYAFDQLVVRHGDKWSSGPLQVSAKDISDVHRVTPFLNTRYGGHGDTMRLHKDQIGVFDPSFLLRNVSAVRIADDQFVVNAPWKDDMSLEGPAAVAMTGSNSPVFPVVNARWIPLVESVDRFGRSRGPVAAMVLNYKGPYEGSNWAFTGVTNRDLFNGDFPVMDQLFVKTCVRLLGGAYLSTLKNGLACYRQGETASLTAKVVNDSGRPPLTVRFVIGGKLVAEQVVKNGEATATWPLPAETADFYECCAELCAYGRVIDRLRTGFSVWKPEVVAQGPTVRFGSNMFSFNGLPLFFGGANTTGMMWFSDNENPLVWKRDFEKMGDYAMNTLRILHFSPFCDDKNPTSKKSSLDLKSRPEKTCRETDAIVQLSQPNQVSLFLSLHDWIPLDLSDEDLKAQQDWNRFWADRYKDVPGMIYDVQNEPGTSLQNKVVLTPLYEGWLAEKYGSLQKAMDAWKASGAEPKIDFTAKAASWRDLRFRDNECFRAWIYARWQRANGNAIKSVAPDAPVTVGHLQNLTASEKVLDTTGVDFVNLHHYGAVQHLRSVLKLIDRRFEGKSFSLGEFGSRTAHTARTRGEWGDPAQDSVRHYLAVGHYALGLGASFIANWSWKDFRDSVFPWGVNHADLTPKPVIEAYRNMMLLFRPVRLRYEEPELYLVLPDSFRLGAENKQIHEALRRSTDWLIGANVPFGVITETSLDRLPEGAKALIWPLAYCPDDDVFNQVIRFVEKGGRLLITGDPRFDVARNPGRLERLAALGFKNDKSAPIPPFETKKLPDSIPFICNDNGKVCRIPLPLELLDVSGEYAPGLYRRFIDEVSGVSRIRLNPDDNSINVFDVAVQNGRMLVALNMSDEHQDVKIPAHGKYPEIQAGIDAGRTLTLMWNKAGEITIAAAQGSLTVAGEQLLPGNGDCAFLSLDEKDLRCSAQIMVLPFGKGNFALSRADNSAELTAELGEFNKGVWKLLESQSLKSSGSTISSQVDSATAYDIRLLSTPEKQTDSRRKAEHLLRIFNH